MSLNRCRPRLRRRPDKVSTRACVCDLHFNLCSTMHRRAGVPDVSITVGSVPQASHCPSRGIVGLVVVDSAQLTMIDIMCERGVRARSLHVRHLHLYLCVCRETRETNASMNERHSRRNDIRAESLRLPRVRHALPRTLGWLGCNCPLSICSSGLLRLREPLARFARHLRTSPARKHSNNVRNVNLIIN